MVTPPCSEEISPTLAEQVGPMPLLYSQSSDSSTVSRIPLLDYSETKRSWMASTGEAGEEEPMVVVEDSVDSEQNVQTEAMQKLNSLGDTNTGEPPLGNATQKKSVTPLTGNELANAIALLDDTIASRRNSKVLLGEMGEPISNLTSQNLHSVCRSGDEEMLRRLLRVKGFRKKINMLDEGDLSPLHLCAKYNHYRCAKVLIDHGASAQVLGDNDTTPLHYCAVYRKFKKSSTGTVKLSSSNLAAGATSDISPGSTIGASTGGGLDAALGAMFDPKLAMNKIAKVLKDEEDNQRKLINLFAKEAKPPIDVNAKDKYGSTALHMASYKSNLAAVKDLIECGADINCRDGQKATPLMLAASYNSPEIFKLLLKNGADYLLVDGEGGSALHIAAAVDKVEITSMLLETVKERSKQLLNYYIGMRNKSTETALHIAVTSNQLENTKVLLENGASAMDPQLDNLYYPMHLSAQNGELPMMKAIYKAAMDEFKNERKVINVTNRECQTPLHRAAMFNRVDCAKFLIEKSLVSDINMREKEGFTPLLLSVSQGHFEVSKLLIDSGADIKETDFDQKNLIHWGVESLSQRKLNQMLEMMTDFDVQDLINDRDNYGNTPAHIAARNGSLDMMQLLHSKECDLKLKNEDEQTPLHLACKYGRTRVVEWMCSLDCDLVKDEDENSNRPLHIAAIEGHNKVTQVLIENQADVQARNFQQWTPLDCAASKGWVKTARILLDNDSPIDPMDRSGITPLYLACKNGHADMVKLLLDWDADVETKASDGRNPLDIAIESGSITCVEAILSDPDSWQYALRNRTKRLQNNVEIDDTPMRKLIRKMPEQALRVFSNCVKTNNLKSDNEDLEMTFLFEFIDDAYSMTGWGACEDTSDLASEFNMDLDLSTVKSNNKSIDGGSTAGDNRSLVSTGEVFADDGTLIGTAQAYTTQPDALVGNHPLTIMVTSEAEHLLRHPLVTMLLMHKWNNFGRFVYYTNLFQYCIFLSFLTGFMIVTKPRNFWDPEFFAGNDKDDPELVDYIKSSYSRTNYTAYLIFHVGGKYVIMISALFNFIRELSQLAAKRMSYVSQVSNFMEWFLYILALVVSVPHVFGITVGEGDTTAVIMWQCGAVSLFLTWINLILFIQKFPKFGIYVVMFTDVLQTFFKFFTVFILFIVAFALGFYCLLQNQEDFSTVIYAMIRTMVMMIGEFDYTDTFFGEVEIEGSWRFSSLTFFTVFMVVMSIITMNLLVGLAVDDIKAVQDSAALQRMAMQVKLALEVEHAIPEWLRKRFVVREQKYFPNRGKGILNKLFAKKMDGPTILQNLVTQREPIEEVEIQQQKVLNTVKKMEKGLHEMKNDQERLLLAVKKLAAANGISIEQDDYTGEIADDED